MKKITLGILETGLPPEEYRDEHGSYPEMFAGLLGEQDANITFRFYAVLDAQLPSAANECDAWLITGSKFGVYEDHSWIAPLEDLVRSAYAQSIPVVGICFGHQLVAQALGGKVVKSDKGWSLGVAEYAVDCVEPWMQGAPAHFSIQAYHQDQVVELPANTKVVASSDFCPYAALNFDNRAITFQGHPEFDASYTGKLLTNRRDLKLLPQQQATEAIANITQPLQREQVAQWICGFLRSAH
ncbi:MAG: type 1 glutamine amidotransferase [Pseudomonadales bacterium]